MLYGEGTVLYRKEETKFPSLNTVVLAEQNGRRLKMYITEITCCNLSEQLLSILPSSRHLLKSLLFFIMTTEPGQAVLHALTASITLYRSCSLSLFSIYTGQDADHGRNSLASGFA